MTLLFSGKNPPPFRARPHSWFLKIIFCVFLLLVFAGRFSIALSFTILRRPPDFFRKCPAFFQKATSSRCKRKPLVRGPLLLSREYRGLQHPPPLLDGRDPRAPSRSIFWFRQLDTVSVFGSCPRPRSQSRIFPNPTFFFLLLFFLVFES